MYEAMRQRRARSVQPVSTPAPARKRKGLGSL
jgi:hypothetical protein